MTALWLLAIPVVIFATAAAIQKIHDTIKAHWIQWWYEPLKIASYVSITLFAVVLCVILIVVAFVGVLQ